MGKAIRPKVVVSRCLGFDTCRYNGQTLPDKFVDALGEFVEYRTVCPEVEIGLGVPRDPIRLVLERGEMLLYQPATGKECKRDMLDYTDNLFKDLSDVDGFLLKGRSPSCGIKDVKVYLGKEKAVGSIKGVGIFGEQVLQHFPGLAIEEEGRLTNYRIREHFLTKIYMLARLREVEKKGTMKELVKYHERSKFLLMTYSQKELKLLGRIVANTEKKPFKDMVYEYRTHFGEALANPPKPTNIVNTLMHMQGYFSDKLTPKEKTFLAENYTKYRDGKVHIGVPVNLLRGYAIKYEQEYLLDQYLWEPFPEELMNISDTGK
ncbi:YbgA family protein [Youngiibacter fragilis]|uniref:DUF1722 domain-containing protein n=1 Tax=Youngiibacter fragilis 232.1 TaxID=994573 RepID=V7HZS5_9CLOT|nr:DUF523 and DUF1722 domain-containing protein [Youngiibacter fragilis]ETA79490.1 hypothetical protein T472_0216655 [Youngiibacter fragilis 232.1]